MAGEFKGLTIKFKGDASDLSAALSRINKDMRITTRSGMEVNRILAMKGASGNVKLLAQNVKIAGDRCKEWQTRLDVLREAQENLGERTVENAAQYDHLTEQIERAEARLDAYTQQLHEAEAAYDRSFTKLGQFGQKLKDLGGHWQTLGQGMQDTGATLTRTVTAPLVALGTVSVKSAVEVDSALTGVRKTLDATEDQYQKLKDAAIESSKQQPVDAATILNIEALGAQLGFGIDELQEFARVASGLDVSTDMGWEDAATNMAQFANIMKMSHGDVGRYASTVVDLRHHRERSVRHGHAHRGSRRAAWHERGGRARTRGCSHIHGRHRRGGRQRNLYHHEQHRQRRCHGQREHESLGRDGWHERAGVRGGMGQRPRGRTRARPLRSGRCHRRGLFNGRHA